MKRLILLLSLAAASGAAAAEVPTATNLAELGRQAGRQGKPLVVFFYQDECHYCETVRTQYLEPMTHNADYTGRIILRKIDTRGDRIMTDFSGEKLSQQRFAHRQKKTFTPTIAFYGPDGEQLVKPLVGLKGGRDYYGHYLDKDIRAAETALQELQ
ncbi:MAG TPA: thioredoxin family protein [Gammaproteobacteria bacterium]|nr:thioredoxin family protein [Gammaproteobacteria bacterium]